MASNLTRILGQAQDLNITSDDLALILKLKTKDIDTAQSL